MAENEQNNNSADQLRNSAKGLFYRWNKRATIHKGDGFDTILGKIALRILGIIVLIVTSPLLLLALLIAFVIAL